MRPPPPTTPRRDFLRLAATLATVTVPLPFARMQGGVLLYGHKQLEGEASHIATYSAYRAAPRK